MLHQTVRVPIGPAFGNSTVGNSENVHSCYRNPLAGWRNAHKRASMRAAPAPADDYPIDVGNHILGGGGLVSRLNEAVREQRGLSYSVNSYFSPMQQDGPYLLSLQTRNDQADEALAVMRETLQVFVDKGPTQDELTASVNNITGGFPLLIENNSKILSYIVMIGFYGLPLDYLETFNDKISAVTREQIMDAYRRRVHPANMVTIIVGGEPKPAAE